MKLLLFFFSLMLCCIYAFADDHVTLVYKGNNRNVIAAVNKANEILRNPAFYEAIRLTAKFDNTILTAPEIAERMEKANQKIVIRRRFKPIANAATRSSNKIKVSRSLFGEDSTGRFVLCIGVNTLIHETVHAIDFLNTGNEFTHDGNRPDGQENTAPWIIGAIAEKMVKEEK